MARTHFSPKTAPPPDAVQASAALDADRFREGAEIHKDLLKRESRPEWTQDAAALRRATGAPADLLYCLEV